MRPGRTSSYKMKPSCRFALVSGALVAALNIGGYFLENSQLRTAEEVEGWRGTERYARSIVDSVDWPHEYLFFYGVRLSASNYLEKKSIAAYGIKE